MNKQSVNTFLIELCDEGSTNAYWRGFEWLEKVLIPNLNAADEMLEEEFELLSDSWCVLGDIHDFNSAPLKALEAYRKASMLDPENPAAYQEMAVLQYAIGKYDDALKNIKTALKLHPSDKDIQDDMAEIQQAAKTNEEVTGIEEDVIWRMSEKLANYQYTEVLMSLENTADIEEAKLVARTYGALEQEKNYLKTWQQIVDANVPFEINYADWFYMPKSIMAGEEIWQLFKKANNNIQEGSIFLHIESLYEHYEKELTEKKARALICEFYTLKATNNTEEIRELKQVFPKWKELKKY